MATKFALARLEIPLSDQLGVAVWFDGNSKITVGNGTFKNPTANAFSLIQIKDCPEATETCKSVCYVHKLEKNEQEVYDKYVLNSTTIRLILSKLEYVETAIDSMAKYIRENCADGFRWHVSGDIFSSEYGLFIRGVCKRSPKVRHWIYTRSFAYVGVLLHLPNLVINLSVDRDNWFLARRLIQRYPTHNLRACYLTVDGSIPYDLPDGSVIFPSHELRGRDLKNPRQAEWWQSITPRDRRMVCPADFFGQSENIRCGPCKKCLV